MDNYSHRYPDLKAIKWLGHNVGDVMRFLTDSGWVMAYCTIGNGMYDILLLTPNKKFKFIELGDYLAKNYDGDINVFNGRQFERFYERET